MTYMIKIDAMFLLHPCWLTLESKVHLKLPNSIHKSFQIAVMSHAVFLALHVEQMTLVAAHLLLTNLSVRICASLVSCGVE